MSRLPFPRTLKTWPVAAAALGGILILFASSVWSTSHKTREMFEELDRLNAHHRRVESVLRSFRSDVNLSGILVRDYLLDTVGANAPQYREQLAHFRSRHVATIAALKALTGNAEDEQILKLERELDQYWKTFDPLFDWTPAEKIFNSAAFIRSTLLPRREAVLTITTEIEKLNDENLAAERSAAARRRMAFQEDLRARLRRSLLIGLLVSFIAVVRLRSLERKSDLQIEHAEDAESEMRMLSQQLVAAQEEERKRVSRDLHDQVGQMLTALRMELGRVSRSGSSTDPTIAEPLTEAKRLVDTILRSVRDLLMGLRPSMLDDFGLQPALEWHVREFRQRFQMQVELEVNGAVERLPDTHRTAVYRIVQEALTNVARHARARRAEVKVSREARNIQVRVADDGVGIEPKHRRGMGLIGIEERVRELRGTFAVQRGPDGGTIIDITIPLKGEEESGDAARLAG